MDYTSFEEIQDLLSHKPNKKRNSSSFNSFGPLGLKKNNLKPAYSQAFPMGLKSNPQLGHDLLNDGRNGSNNSNQSGKLQKMASESSDMAFDVPTGINKMMTLNV